MTLDEQKNYLSAAFNDGPHQELTFTPMFGGAGAYVNGRIFAWIFKFGMALKADAETAKEWANDGAKALQFEEDGPIFKAHIVIPEEVIKDTDKLSEWVEQSIKYVWTLPAPKPRNRRKKQMY
ncbi:TfoX family protein [bacterium]|nr:MAG: TfoX family protein [bacterium]